MSGDDPTGPDFDGETYEHDRDYVRLTGQLKRVYDMLADGEWHTIPELHSAHPADSPQAISARIRDLRKNKFGGHVVHRENVGGGLWRYRLVRRGRHGAAGPRPSIPPDWPLPAPQSPALAPTTGRARRGPQERPQGSGARESERGPVCPECGHPASEHYRAKDLIGCHARVPDVRAVRHLERMRFRPCECRRLTFDPAPTITNEQGSLW